MPQLKALYHAVGGMLSLMSGGLAVLLGIVGPLIGLGTDNKTLAIASLGFIVVVQTFRLLPKLQIRHGKELSGCFTENTLSDGLDARFFRFEVTALHNAEVKDCKVHLKSIQRDGKTLFDGESVLLTFSPGGSADGFSKTIRAGVEEWADILFLSQFNAVRFTTEKWEWNFSKSMIDIFSAPGDYVIMIVVTGNEVPSIQREFIFTYTDDWRSADMRLRGHE